MNARTVTCFALLTLAALTASCTSGGDSDKPASPAPTVTKTVDQAAARKACVDAWADLLQGDEEAGIDDEPADCDGLPEDDRMDRYFEGLQQRNKANRDAFNECTEDPTCTSMPIP